MAVHDGLRAPWCWLIEAQLLSLVALGFFVAAHRFHEKRFSWLLSSSVAVGFAIAAFYNFVAATGARAIPAAGVGIMFIAIMLFAGRAASQPRRRR
jgi:hypothetical protein